jgi:hypothetical protein
MAEVTNSNHHQSQIQQSQIHVQEISQGDESQEQEEEDKVITGDRDDQEETENGES